MIYVTHQVEFLPSADLILVSHSHLVSIRLILFLTRLMDGSFRSFISVNSTYKSLLGDERWQGYSSWEV